MHEFILIKKSEAQVEKFFLKFNRNRENCKNIIIDYITVDIKVFEYIYDSHTWIPCMNPALGVFSLLHNWGLLPRMVV